MADCAAVGLWKRGREERAFVCGGLESELLCGVAAFIPGAGGCRSQLFRAAGDEDRYDRGLVSSCVRFAASFS